jgi:hypothetical protein
VFGQYPDCDSLLGLPCTVSGSGVTKRCCDHIDSSNYVRCWSFQVGGAAGTWAGPGSCEQDLMLDEAFCVSLKDSSDYCAAGSPVLPMMEFTNFCQLINSTTALDGLG